MIYLLYSLELVLVTYQYLKVHGKLYIFFFRERGAQVLKCCHCYGIPFSCWDNLAPYVYEFDIYY